jgi:hypothetical protein
MMRSDKALAARIEDWKTIGTRPIKTRGVHPTKTGKWIATYDEEGGRVVGLVVESRTPQAPTGVAMLVIAKDGKVAKRQISRYEADDTFYTAKATELEAGHRKAIRSLAAGLESQPTEPGNAPMRKGNYDYFKSPTPDDLKAWIGTEVTAWCLTDGTPGLLTKVTATHAVIWQPYWKANREITLEGTTYQRAVQGQVEL